MALLEVTNLVAGYGKVEVISDVSFTLEPGKSIGIVGPNGVGKSTLLQAIAGGIAPKGGSIIFDGKNIAGKKPEDIVRLGLSLVPEGRQIFSGLTVKENLSLASREKNSDEAYKLVYSLFPELDTRASQLAGSLSGGQQQMVAIARALLNKNEILLVDEPTKGLAPKLVSEVADVLMKVAEHSTMLLVEQNLSLVKKIAQHVIVMDQGRVVYQGGPENLNDDSWVHQMLGVSGGHK